MALLRYISHPEVVIDGAVPVARWSLTAHGRSRAEAAATRPWVRSLTRLICSDETKAVEAATAIAARNGLIPEVRPGTGEIDRSATGFVPEPAYSDVSAAFFANPERSPHGWERAVDGQTRIRSALADVLVDGAGDVAVVGHGGVGTLLWCHLAGLEIAERYDQPFAGHVWTYDRATATVVHPWLPLDGPDLPSVA
ncbi:MAG: histidine phosphatase family protein [Actinomycetota bacterium]